MEYLAIPKTHCMKQFVSIDGIKSLNNRNLLLPLQSISLGVPVRAEIIPFEPEQVHACGGTKIAGRQISFKKSYLTNPLFCLTY